MVTPSYLQDTQFWLELNACHAKFNFISITGINKGEIIEFGKARVQPA